ncbi:hypothetical protein TSAR_010820 [Trichomalopsis sarcophagae]|uniref:Uncharacterized protein n=1 Tax=Trichomalopsis sarcophagae TaxID=543379 RepID=A0A232EEC0_9HYME|nr:hypothetical protein TSAR_010820 [Trichomalopsis sarcophagae]
MAVQFWGPGVEKVPELEMHESDPGSDDDGYASEVGSVGEAGEEVGLSTSPAAMDVKRMATDVQISYRVISAGDEPSPGEWIPCHREDWDAPEESCLICGQFLGDRASCLRLSGKEISYRVISAEDEPFPGGWIPCHREEWDAPEESCLHLSGKEQWIPVPCLG